MIDHLLWFSDEAAAMAACPAYVSDGGEDGPQWDGSRCIPGVAVEVPTGQMTEATEEELSRPVMARVPGWWIAIATTEADPGLIALPQCRVASDREAMDRGDDHFVYLAADVDLGMLVKARVSPVFDGSKFTV